MNFNDDIFDTWCQVFNHHWSSAFTWLVLLFHVVIHSLNLSVISLDIERHCKASETLFWAKMDLLASSALTRRFTINYRRTFWIDSLFRNFSFATNCVECNNTLRSIHFVVNCVFEHFESNGWRFWVENRRKQTRDIELCDVSLVIWFTKFIDNCFPHHTR